MSRRPVNIRKIQEMLREDAEPLVRAEVGWEVSWPMHTAGCSPASARCYPSAGQWERIEKIARERDASAMGTADVPDTRAVKHLTFRIT